MVTHQSLIGASASQQHTDILETDFLKEQKYFHYQVDIQHPDQLRVSCQEVRGDSTYFTLIKGLIEFYRKGNQHFSFHSVDHRFTINIPFCELPALRNLLQFVFRELEREISFKSKLKAALEFERRYRDESKLVYQSII